MAGVREEDDVRAGLTGRVAKVGAVVPEGCCACRSWPHVRFLRDGEPEPPTMCGTCGRECHGLTRVFVIERVARGGGVTDG